MVDRCILCGFEKAKVCEGRYFYTTCPNCGEFCHPWYGLTLSDNDKHLLSGLARELTDKAFVARKITDEINRRRGLTDQEFADRDNVLNLVKHSIDDLLQSPFIPHSPMEKLNKLLLWLYRNTKFFGQKVKVVIESHPSPQDEKSQSANLWDTNYMKSICYAANDDEFLSIRQVAQTSGYISGSDECSLTFSGHQHCQEIERKGVNTNNVFVAMWFNDEVSSAYDEAINPAIEGCGYRAVRIDRKEHNSDINDEIIAGIKDSKFVVADLTGYRGGVYFEVGYAKGLGKEVILSCRKDWFDGEKGNDGKWEKEAVHFDINHLNTIVWEKPEELKGRLSKRIEATIGNR